jgi:hypothetical protein
MAWRQGVCGHLWSCFRQHAAIQAEAIRPLCLVPAAKPAGGDFLEVGTLQGGTAALLAFVFSGSKLMLWDNWGKQVQHDDYFVKKAYSESKDLERTRALIQRLVPAAAELCVYVDELFPNEAIIQGCEGTFSLIHFDIYDRAAFENGVEMIWPNLMNGAIFIVSAYGSISLDSLTNAVKIFAQKHDDCIFIQSQSGMGLLIKRANETTSVFSKTM